MDSQPPLTAPPTSHTSSASNVSSHGHYIDPFGTSSGSGGQPLIRAGSSDVPLGGGGVKTSPEIPFQGLPPIGSPPGANKGDAQVLGAGAPPPPPPRGGARAATSTSSDAANSLSRNSTIKQRSGALHSHAAGRASAAVPVPLPPQPMNTAAVAGDAPAPFLHAPGGSTPRFGPAHNALPNSSSSSGHPLSLKVMRISQPSLATYERPYFEGTEYADAEQRFFRAVMQAREGGGEGGGSSGQESNQDDEGLLWRTLDPEMSQEEINELLRFSEHHHNHQAVDGDSQTSGEVRRQAPKSTLMQVHEAWQQAAEEDIIINQRSSLGKDSAISTMRDWQISDMLVLPSSFGTVCGYDLGETFSGFVCVNNESQEPIAGVTLRVEMQFGPGAAPAPSNPQSSMDPNAPTHTVLLANVHHGNIAQSTSGTPNKNDAPLEPYRKLETTVKHDISQIGPHVLICTVIYYLPAGDPNASHYGDLSSPDNGGKPAAVAAYREQTFRKFYRFNVAECPITVRTKSHVPVTPGEKYHKSHYVREKVLLEIQVANPPPAGQQGSSSSAAGGKGLPLVIEDVSLANEHEGRRWCWRSVDRPHIKSANWSDDVEAALTEWHGDKLTKRASSTSDERSHILLPGDVRQYLFELFPVSKTPARPLPPIPASGPADAAGRPHPASRASSYSTASLNKPQPLLGSPFGQNVKVRSSATPLTSPFPSLVQPFMISVPLGKIDVRWRAAMGESGHLQTSTLVQQFQYPAPVLCSAEAQMLIPRNVQLTPQPDSQAPPPPPLPKTAGVEKPLMLQCQVRILELPKDPTMLEPFEVKYHIWIRDVLLVREASRIAAEEEDDSDEDTPLSEVAKSPRASATSESRRGSFFGVSTDQQPVEGKWIRLAVQFTKPTFPISTSDHVQAAVTTSLAPVPLGRSGTPTRQLGYAPRSSLDSTITLPQSPATSDMRAAPNRAATPSQASRPGAPTNSKAAASQGVPPPPPPKTNNALEPAKTHPKLPRPFAEVHSDTHDVPDEEVTKIGNSLEFLAPIRLASSSASDGDQQVFAGEAISELAATYVSEVQGLVKIGGLRILLMGWWSDREQAQRKSDSASDDPGYRLAEPVLVKDVSLSTLAEMLVGPVSVD